MYIFFFLELLLVTWDIFITYFLIFFCTLDIFYILEISPFLKNIFSVAWIYILFYNYLLFHMTSFNNFLYPGYIFFLSKTTPCPLRYPCDLLFHCLFLLFCVVGPVRPHLRERVLRQTVAKILLILNCDVI